MRHSANWTRRDFLTSASCAGAALACAKFWPSAARAEALQQDSRVAATPLLDKGFASTRKIGDGVYATIADPTKGMQALSNGGFIIGKDSALLIEGHMTPAAAAVEHEALRMVSQLPVRAAIDTHYHLDHSFGNTFYGAQNIPVWAHAKAAPLIVEKYTNLQGKDLSGMLTPIEKRIQEAKDETEKQHAESDLNLTKLITQALGSMVIALPNHPLDPAALPMTVDLGGVKAVIETHPGHSPTDLIVRVLEQNIVFTGDLLFNGSYPVTLDAAMSPWIQTLDKFAAFGKDTLFVPGHGPLGGQESVTMERAILESPRDHAQKMFKAGVPVEEAKKRYAPPEQFKDLRYFSRGYSVELGIQKFYEEWRGANK